MPGRRDDTKMSEIQGMQLIQEVASSTGTFHEELKVLAFDRTTIGGGGGSCLVCPLPAPLCLLLHLLETFTTNMWLLTVYWHC